MEQLIPPELILTAFLEAKTNTWAVELLILAERFARFFYKRFHKNALGFWVDSNK